MFEASDTFSYASTLFKVTVFASSELQTLSNPVPLGR